MINIKNILICAAALLLAACTNHEMTDMLPDADGQPIRFNIGPPPTFTDVPGTRAKIEDIEGGQAKVVWENGDVLSVMMLGDDFERYGTLTYDNNEWTASTELRWPVGYTEAADFYVLYGSTSEDCAPFYQGTGTGNPTGNEVALIFGNWVNQLVFRGIKPGQELKVGTGWLGRNRVLDGYRADMYSVTGFFTDTDGDGDIVLYLYPNSNSDLTYFIDGVQAGDLSGVVSATDTGKRLVIYCNEGGASAGDIEAAERDKFLEWYNGGMSTDFTLKSDITLADPIRSKNLPAGKTFDGGGHTIRGLVTNNGLFLTNYGTIKNVIVQGAQVQGTGYAGAIATVNQNTGTIVGCQAIDCTVTPGENYDGGGIVANNLGGKVIACHTSGGTVNGTGGARAGGTAGINGAGQVIACYAAPTEVTGSSINIGVVVGLNTNTIVTACYWQHDTLTKGIGYDNSGTGQATQSDLNATAVDAMNTAIAGTAFNGTVSWSVNGLVYP